MTTLRNFDFLIDEIHTKIIQYQKGNKIVTKKEVKDFIYFLRKSN